MAGIFRERGNDYLTPKPPPTRLSSSSKATIANIIDAEKRSRRRAGKRKTRSRSQDALPEANASTSRTANVNPATSNVKMNGRHNNQANFEDQQDFIPLMFSDTEEELDYDRPSKSSPPVREKDNGKGKARDGSPRQNDRSKEQSRERSPPSRRNAEMTIMKENKIGIEDGIGIEAEPGTGTGKKTETEIRVKMEKEVEVENAILSNVGRSANTR
jgi:hypothetical protein